MKVYIGPYTYWTGPYQLADILQKFGVSEDRCYEIGEWLDDKTPLTKICRWIDTLKKRKVQIHIDNYDTWNCDSTLSVIILPLLKRFKELKHSSAWVDDDDVPENLRSCNASPKENDWEWDDLNESRWNWILDELIWTFEHLQPDNDWEMEYHKGVIDFKFVPIEGSDNSEMVKGPNDTHEFDKEGFEIHSNKIKNGLRLFGKYYQNLWD